MDLVNIRDLFRSKDEYLDTTVTIGGWVRSLRNSKNFGFIVVNDGTFFEPVQVVFSNVLENFEEVEKLNVGAALMWRELPHRIIRCRRRSTALSI